MKERRKILVVDDESVIVNAARRILSAEGYPVVTAQEAESALELLPAAQPAVTVIDLKLPGRSGIEFLSATRVQYPAMPVIIMTGFSSIDNAIAALKNGAFDFLPKPFSADELLSPVARACRYLELQQANTNVPASSAADERYLFGLHVWAQLTDGPTATLGLTQIGSDVMGDMRTIELPVVGEHLQQGRPLARIAAGASFTHTIWSPISGRVAAVNDKLEQDLTMLRRDPTGEGWIARLTPIDLENELQHLVPIGK